MNWLLTRLREPSSWRGLIWLLTVLGVSIRPELWEPIATVGMAVAGLLGILLQEKPAHVEVHLPPLDLVGRAAGPAAERPADPAAGPDPAGDPWRVDSVAGPTGREPAPGNGWNG